MKPSIQFGSPQSLGRECAHVPVAIVGAGASGLVAALTLHHLGVDCVVVERDVLPRGSTALSSGFIPAPGTKAQARQGIHDSVAAFEQDIQRKAHDTANPTLVSAYAAAIGPAMDFLEDQRYLRWQVLDNFLYPGHRHHRMHAVEERSGEGLMQRLTHAAQTAQIPLLCNATVSTLWSNQGVITGISYVTPNGQQEHIACSVLVLACNGFAGNTEMVKQYLPEIANAQFGGHSGNDGSAIAWGLELGVAPKDMNAYQGHGSWAIPQGALISWALMMQGAIQVNANGQRFHDETQGYSEAAVHVLAQPGGIAWNVFDEPLYALGKTFPDFLAAEQAGAVKKFSTLEDLAAAIGCSLQALAASCGRLASEHGPLTAPYYAIKVTGALFHTQGGLSIDAHCRAVKADGSIIPNLLASGGAAGGVSGNAVWGYLSGNGLLSAVAGGYIAAHSAEHYLKNL